VAVARKLARPIKWTEERAEGYLATIHGRDMYQEIELAATADGVLKAVRVKLYAAMGAYLRVVSPAIPMLGAWLYAGVYDPEAYRRELAARRQRGDTKQLGVGFSTYLEMCGLAPSRVLAALRYAGGGWEASTIEMMPTGTVQVKIGTSPHGQGHATTFSQMVADQLGVDFGDVEVIHGDTHLVPLGLDTYGSRSLAVGG